MKAEGKTFHQVRRRLKVGLNGYKTMESPPLVIFSKHYHAETSNAAQAGQYRER
jgi:hypothetical protein